MEGLTAVEQRVWDAFPRGEEINLRTGDAGRDDPAGAAGWGAERVVRAEVIARLLLGAGESEPGRVPALRLAGARVDGELDLEYGAVAHPMTLTGCALPKPVKLRNARVRDFGLVGCVLAGVAAADVTVDGSLLLDASRIDGPVLLRGAQVDGDVSVHGTLLLAPGADAVALDLRQAKAKQLDLRPATPVEGLVDLGYASVSVLQDDIAGWPDHLRLDGLTYDQLATPLTMRERLGWLARSGGYFPQPFEQLARTYRAAGLENDARGALLAKERVRHSTLPWYARIWGIIQNVTVGYGYRPIRAGMWAVGLTAAGSIVFSIRRPAPTEVAGTKVFNPVVFTLDHLSPVVGFGQGDAFTPTPGTQWVGYALTAAGWILATTIATGVTRSVTKL